MPSQLTLRVRARLKAVLREHGPLYGSDLVKYSLYAARNVRRALADWPEVVLVEDEEGVWLHWLAGEPLPEEEPVPVYDYTDAARAARAEAKRRRALVVVEPRSRALVPAGHYRPLAAPCAQCGAPVTVPAQRYHGQPLCAACARRTARYEERVAARVAHLEARADRKAQEAQETLEEAHDLARAIPFGQPVLVGHHSEGRDRRYRARIAATFRRGFEARAQAADLQRRAEAAQANRAVSSDDPLAVLRLEQKLAEREALQDRMKVANRAIRLYAKQGPQAQVRALVSLGFDEATAREVLEPDYRGRVGFPDYRLRNNNAEIRRLRARIAALRARAEQAGDDSGQAIEDLPGVRIVRSRSDNRLRLVFASKPPDAVRAILKRSGWRWSRAHTAWQRQLNANSEAALDDTLRQIRALK